MADPGEWNRKGAVLSDVTAQKEYGVTREFVVAGINAGKLEFREGSVWSNPFLRVLRSQLEPYIAAELGPEYLSSAQIEDRTARHRERNCRSQEKAGVAGARKAALEGAKKK
jgi:hypothetical protein